MATLKGFTLKKFFSDLQKRERELVGVDKCIYNDYDRISCEKWYYDNARTKNKSGKKQPQKLVYKFFYYRKKCMLVKQNIVKVGVLKK